MNSKLTRRALLGFGLVLPVLGGCGGGSANGGGNSGSSDPTRGTLSLTLTFPALRSVRNSGKSRVFGGDIPLGSQAVQVTVSDPTSGAALAPPKLITASVTASTLPETATVLFTALPVGPVLVQAVVFPDAAAKQNPIAIGSAMGQIVASTTTNVMVTFTLTLAHFIVSQTSITVSPDTHDSIHSVTVDAIVQDSSSRALQYPIFWLSASSEVAQVTFDPANPAVATITGVSEGATIVTVVEPNSGMTAAVNVTSRIQ